MYIELAEAIHALKLAEAVQRYLASTRNKL